MVAKLDDVTLLATVSCVRECAGNKREAARRLGIDQSRVVRQCQAAQARGLVLEIGGQLESFESKSRSLPTRGKRKVYILTCAQNNTKLHAECWKNLLALAEHDDAEIMVSLFKYNKDAMGQRDAAKSDSARPKGAPKYATREAEIGAEYPAEVRPYVCDDRVNLTDNLTFCGELNIMPTAEQPLSGLESYTYRKSTIVPHPKLALASVPAMPGEGVKLMMTTGCVTQRNYIARKVGFKAEHYHSYGALIVEIDASGSWFPRQLVHGPDGAIYDKDRRIKDGKVTTGHRVADITWGDVHATRVDEQVAAVSWGHNRASMLETLKPSTQHVHDLLDFSGRSHHTRRDPHAVFRAHINGEWILTGELVKTRGVLVNEIMRPWCHTFVVDSNHDRHLNRWLQEVDWRDDPANAIKLLELNLAILKDIATPAGKPLNLLAHALGLADEVHGLTFLTEDESHVILPEIDGGIECGLHGDRGANGARGTINGIARTDRKINGADKHVAAIVNHSFWCGTSAKLRQGWNHGLSSWTHAHIVTYPNGTRSLYHLWRGKWQA